VTDRPIDQGLQEEFRSLTGKLGLEGLRLVWIPGASKGIAGEVRDGTVFLYEKDQARATETLKHELVDHMITSKIVNPLVGLVNALIRSRETEIYQEKEKIVELLSKLV